MVYPVRSLCPWCKHQISWWQNFPVLSFLLLKGKCHQCHSRIHWRYPVVELCLPLLLLLGWKAVRSGLFNLYFPFYLAAGVFLFVLLVSTFTDLDWRIIPDQVSFLLMAVSLVTSPWNPFLQGETVFGSFLNSVQSGVLAGTPLWIVSFFGKKLMGRETMGGGDIKLMIGMGCFLGWKSTLIILFMGSILGALFVGIGFIFGFMKRNQYIPFGPFLNIAAALEFFLRCKHVSLFALVFNSTGQINDILKKIP